ncbi:MAG TPA: hypothetical protein VKF59_19050 [Candidatus Dormibacteraeota bacterium]|nr:hypothetical protein [Candidatus Dormibacteraeota bacterium]
MLTPEQAFPSRVAGILRADDPEAAFKACVAALEGGLATIEVTTSTPFCLDIVRGLVASTGGTLAVGVGTVWEPAEVTAAKQAGAAFVATSAVLPEVADACVREDLLCVLGALTPTEIDQARRSGAGLVKVFPVGALGGPGYVRWLRGPMPDLPLWVSGGIEIEDVEEYISLGVTAVGLTGALFPPDAIRRGDLALINSLARRATRAAGMVWHRPD